MKNTLKLSTPSDREIFATRTFDAPRRLVWEAMSKPELIRRWLFGPPGWEMTTCDDDPRAGGKFLWAWRGPDGQEMTMHGTYREVVAPERAVRNEIFEMGGNRIGEQLATMVLSEQNGVTTMKLTLLYDSKQARDGAIASGMEQGMAIGYDRLDEMLATPAGGGKAPRKA